jgi:transposase
VDEYPKIVARAKTEDAEIHWGNETAMRQDSPSVRGYSMAGLTPVLRLPTSRHGSTSMISAITNQGLVRFSFFESAIDAERFFVFLKDLVQDAQRKEFLIVDNRRVHRANRVREWVAENTEKIELFYLPPYASELNPDEYLKREVKATIRSGPIAKTAAALLKKARTCMERIAAMPGRVRSYFSHEHLGTLSKLSICSPGE